MAFGSDGRRWWGAVATLGVLLWCLLGFWGPAFAADAEALPPGAAGRGFVDQAQVQGRRMRVTGWAGAAEPHVFVTNAIVRVAGREVYRGRMQRSERPDVADATGRPAWRGSGFEVRFQLPRSLPAGPQPVEVAMRLGDGREFTLAQGADTRTVVIEPSQKPSAPITLALGLALVLPGLVWLGRRHLPARWRDSPRPLALALGTSFALLVGAGVTGSSLPLLLGPPTVVEHDARVWMGEPRPVRSDEWQVLTPLALAQAAHVPRFPVVNRLLGADGENMLVIGMTGMPVAHVSAWVRPATWGFFVFDMPRALAWAWWLPLFGALGACGWLLMRLTGLGWQPALVLAACAVLAPYSVAYSSWPAYLLMFAALGLLAVDRGLHAVRMGPALAWGAALGWAASGYALLLYPAWQISVATLCGPLTLAWAWRERAHWRWTRAQTAGLLVAVAVCAITLGSWWIDARDAVATMRATVYPGQRATEAGGDVVRWFLFKGWWNPLTMHMDAPMGSSEAASYPFIWVGTVFALALSWLRARRAPAVSLVLAGFVVFVLVYKFIGFPPFLARASLWSVVTAYRLDLALGFAQILLIGWLLAQPGAPRGDRVTTGVAAAAAAATLAQAAWEVSRMPLDITESLPEGFLVLCALASAAAAALLVARRGRALLWLYAGWVAASVLTFHPLVRAPSMLSVVEPLRAAGVGPATGDAQAARVAVIGERNWAMALPAAGVPVVNSVFYYPQPSLWRALDPQGAQRDVYNRYQRLLLELAPQYGGRGYVIDSPRLDEVRVTLDPVRFDFRLLGADFVLAPTHGTDALSSNDTLEPLLPANDARGYVLLRVRR